MKELQIDPKLQFAVLIDSDNVSSRYAAVIFDELEKYGFATYRRIYGNWSKNNSWNRETLLEYSIMPVQQFDYTNGKNSTDIAMVIDAMDLLYKDGIDGYCLVTSDSDFTRLAMRLREESKYIIGMGEDKTPKALIRACNKFIYLNLIGSEEKEEEHSHPEKIQKEKEEGVTSLKEIEMVITSLMNEGSKTNIDLGLVGSRLADKYADFDVRNYGYTKLSTLIDSEMKSLRVGKAGNHRVIEKEILDQQMVEEQVLSILKKHGGEVENLSVIYEELKKKHPKFDVRDYGFARVSSFLRNIKGLKVTSNKVTLKK